MPHDGTAEAPSKFRAIVFITDKLGKFLALFFGGVTHAWGVNASACFVFNIYNVRGNQHALLIGSLGDRGDDGAEMTTRVRTIVNAMQP